MGILLFKEQETLKLHTHSSLYLTLNPNPPISLSTSFSPFHLSYFLHNLHDCISLERRPFSLDKAKPKRALPLIATAVHAMSSGQVATNTNHSESKSAKKKKAKAAAAVTSPGTPDADLSTAADPTTNGSDASSESPYLRELNK